MMRKHLLTSYIISREIGRMRGEYACPMVELEYLPQLDAVELRVDGTSVCTLAEETLALSLDNFSEGVLYPLFGHVLTHPAYLYCGP